jgi:general stress protein 26
LVFSLLYSCTSNKQTYEKLRIDFSKEETDIIKLSKEMIRNCYYGSFITIDQNGQPKSRVMEPFAPDENMEIWMATNPRSRKVKEIKNNSKTTLHYFDKNNMGYVSFYGNAYIVNDDSIKSIKWKKGWEQFYKNQKEDFMLIRFIPTSLELINISKGYKGNKKSWKPHEVILR